MNRAEAAEKEWIDRAEADRARDLAWEQQRDAVRERQRQADRAPARPREVRPELSLWQRILRALGAPEAKSEERAPRDET